MYRKLLTFVVLLLAAGSCQKSEVPAVLDFGGEIQFKLGEIVRSDDSKISLKITDINDSRCPSDVVCFWQGEAKVKFELNYNGTVKFELSTFFHPVDTINSLIFKLIEVSPYPVSTKTIELKDYVVRLEVEELE